jgi:serine/threonine-protein kinase
MSQKPLLRAGQVLNGRYRVGTLLARGGFGEVYEAFDMQLERRVALKYIFQPLDLNHLHNEVKILAANAERLRFMPNVYDFWRGTRGIGYYIVMEYVEGPTLNESESLPWPGVRVSDFLRALLDNLHHLHQSAIIHCDIKPVNIKATPEQQRAVQFPYRLLDFGIARRDDHSAIAAASPHYAAPEQHGLGANDIDKRVDLYALGATAYFLLTGQKPSDARERYDAVLKTGQDTLNRPSRMVAGVPPGLEALLLELMQLERERRPADAAAALTLLEQLATQPEVPSDAPEISGGTELVAPSLEGADANRTDLSLPLSHIEQAPQPIGRQQSSIVNRQSSIENMPPVAYDKLASDDEQQGEVPSVAIVAQPAQPIPSFPLLPPSKLPAAPQPAPELPAVHQVPSAPLWREAERAAPGEGSAVEPREATRVCSVQLEGEHAAGLWLAVQSTAPASAERRTATHNKEHRLSAIGYRLFTSLGSELCLWTLEGDQIKQLSALPATQPTRGVALGGKWLASAEGGEIVLRRRGKAKVERRLSLWPAQQHGLAISPDGSHLLVLSEQALSVVTTQTGDERARVLLDEGQGIEHTALSADCTAVATHSRGMIVVRAVADGAERWRLRVAGELRALALAPDGQRLAAVVDRVLVLWELGAGQIRLLGQQAMGSAPAHHLAFASDGEAIVALQGNEARVWGLGEGIVPQPMLCRHTGRVSDAVLLDGKRVVTAGADGVVGMWEVGEVQVEP